MRDAREPEVLSRRRFFFFGMAAGVGLFLPKPDLLTALQAHVGALPDLTNVIFVHARAFIPTADGIYVGPELIRMGLKAGTIVRYADELKWRGGHKQA